MTPIRSLARGVLDVALGRLVAAIGVVVLVSWLLRWDAGLQLLPGRVPMQFNTALGFVAAGLALGVRTRVVGLVAAGVVAGLGLLTLAQYAFSIDLGIDQLLHRPHLTVHTSNPGRMAPMTAIGFAGFGSVVLLAWRLRGHGAWVSGVRGIGGAAVLALGLTNLLGYALGIDTPFGWHDASYMAIHTATCFVLLGAGMLHSGWREAFESEEATIPAWLPVAAGMVGLAVALASWQVLFARENALVENLVRRDLERMVGGVELAFEDARMSILRMKHRVTTGLPDESTWRIDASGYLGDRGYFEAIDLLLPDGRHWGVGTPEAAGAGGAEKIGRLCDSLMEPVAAGSDPFSTSEGGRLRICSPVAPGGWLVATVAPERLLDTGFRGRAQADHVVELLVGAEAAGALAAPEDPNAVVLIRSAPVELGEHAAAIRSTPAASYLASLRSPGPSVGLALGVASAFLIGAAFAVARRSEGRARRLEALRRSLDRRIGEATEALAASEARYQDLYQHAPDFYLQIDAATQRIRDCNETFAQRLGRAREEIIGSPVLEIYHPDSRKDAEAALRIFREYGEVTQPGLMLETVDGTTVPVDLKATAFRDAAGQVLFSRSMLRDMSEVHELQTLLFEARSREILGRLAGGVAHDFNNLLTVILGSLEVALDELAANSPARDSLDDARAASERAAELVRQLLSVGRRQLLRPTPRSLPALVDTIQPVLRRVLPEHIEFQIAHEDSEAPVVRTDVAQFEQLLLNLVLNARDAMPQGGLLAVETGTVEIDVPTSIGRGDPARSHVRNGKGGGNGGGNGNGSAHRTRALLAPGRYGWMTVSDTGDGIDRTLMERVFEPFFTTKAEGSGSGLGLASASGFAEQSGGGLEVESEQGLGTTFRLYLPVSEEHALLPASQPDPTASFEGDETVLVVDDQPALRGLIRHLLEGKGYRVLEAASSAHALSVVHTESIDLLLTDVVMPEGSGADLASAVHAIDPDLPVLFMSGYSAETIFDQGIREVTLLGKPFRPVELWHRVREALNAARRSD